MTAPPNDRLRQCLNLALALFQFATPALAPVLKLGKDIGSRSAEVQTPVVPAGYAFLIWSFIYPATLAYAVWQCLPAQRQSSLLRAIGWWTAGAFLANGLWPIGVQLNTFDPLSLLLIVAEAVCLSVALLRMRAYRATMTATEVALVRVPLSVFAGWVTAATFVNFAAMLRVLDAFPVGANEVPMSIAILVAAGLVAGWMTVRLRGNLGYLFAVVWALIAVVWANTQQADRPAVAWTAGILAVAIVGLGVRMRLTTRIAALMLVALTAPAALGQSPTPEPVRIPQWVRETTGVGYTLSAMNLAQRTEAVRHGVTISEMNFVDPYYPYYDSKLLKKRSPHVPIANIDKEIAEYRKLGLRILAVYPPTLQSEVYENHLDWRRIDTDTTTIPQIDMKKFGHGGMLCPLGPYGEFFVDLLAEMLQMHPQIDAFSFDGLHHGGVCYCEHCRKNYRADTGKVIPKADLNDGEFRRYQVWADRRLESLIERMQKRLKGIKPEVALVTWTTNAGRFGHFLSVPRNMPARLNRLFDAPDQELWLDESNRGNSIVPAFGAAYAWAVTDHRVAFSEPYLMSHGNPYGKDSFPAHEILRRMMLCITYGNGASIAVSQPPRMQKDVYACLEEVQKRKAWLTNKSPEPWAALVMSDNTKNFYGRSSGRVEERYLSHVFGTFRACVEEHLPTTVIEDWKLTPEELRKYAVLILPNTACLDAAQVRAIDEYVRNGGGLVASLDASLFDEFGDPRPNFGLADAFGVDYRGLPDSTTAKEVLDINFAKTVGADYWEKRRNTFSARLSPDTFLLKNDRLSTYIGTDPVTFKGPAVRVRPREGSLSLGTLETSGVAPVKFPAITSRTHGKGRVVYLAAGFDAGYYQYAYPYQRLILKEAIAWAANETPMPVRVEAPMCVHSTVMRQTTGDTQRLIVHLFNDINTTGGHAFPNDDVPLREETLPIHDIRVTFRSGTKIASVRLQPEGRLLEMKVTGQGIAVTVPRLEVHAMVVAELEK